MNGPISTKTLRKKPCQERSPVDYKPLSVNVKNRNTKSRFLCVGPRFGVLNENVNRDAPQPTATDDGECGVCVEQSRKASYEENSSEYYTATGRITDHRNFLVSCESSGKNARLSPVLTLVVRFRCGRCEDAAVTNRYYVCASPSTPGETPDLSHRLPTTPIKKATGSNPGPDRHMRHPSA